MIVYYLNNFHLKLQLMIDASMNKCESILWTDIISTINGSAVRLICAGIEPTSQPLRKRAEKINQFKWKVEDLRTID